MSSRRSILCALLIGPGVALAGCSPQPTIYSGAYLSPRGSVYGGLTYDNGYAAYAAGPNYFRGPYHGGYYWRNGYPHRRRLYRWYVGGDY